MNISDIQHKTILYAALDWGYGHVTRSIGIIQELLVQDNQVIIVCNQEQQILFKSYFPGLKYEFLEGYNFQFKGKGKWAWDLFRQRKSFFSSIQNEQKCVEKWVQKHGCDLVISDHRYGFYSKSIPSIFVTHQLHLPISKLFFSIQKWHEKQIYKFSIMWVLDDEKSTLAGKLSRKIKHPNLYYIGWKSRFKNLEKREIKYDYLIVVSGPKPYSILFLDEIQQKVDFNDKKIAVLYPISLEIAIKNSKFDYFSASDLKTTDNLFLESEIIISRSGYSTIMDLKLLGKKSILIPTKGQKEQEYLVKHLFRDGNQ